MIRSGAVKRSRPPVRRSRPRAKAPAAVSRTAAQPDPQASPASPLRAGSPAADPAGFRGRHPTPLAFGTSGLRGLVSDITDLEAYINTRGFLEYLVEIGVARGESIPIAGDLRPSTDGADHSILRAVARAVEDSGFHVDNLGK